MRKIIVFNLITIDGYYAGVNGEIDWHMTDNEFDKFSIDQLSEFGLLIFGRTTYTLMANYWPTTEAMNSDPIVAKLMNSIPKIFYSKTVKKVVECPNWKNIRLYNEIDPEEIQKIKNQNGKDIAIFGSGTIVRQFADYELIDEYRLLINPIILGSGLSLFKDIKKTKLKFLESKLFGNGNILLIYLPDYTK